MDIREGIQLIENGTKKAIIEFVFTDYIIYVFQGNLSQFDILMKMQGNEELTKKYLLAIQNCWNTCAPLSNNDFETLKNLIESGEKDIEIEQYFYLNAFGEYDVEFLYVLMELLAVQEKTNRADAYMFGKIIEELLEADRDIFKIISTAGFGGRRG